MTVADLFAKTDISPLLSVGKYLLIGYAAGQIIGVLLGIGFLVYVIRKFK